MIDKGNDMITSDYLLWLEQTARAQGLTSCSRRFNKGYGPGESSFDMRGQGSMKVLKTTPASDHSQTLAPRLPATRMSSRATTSTSMFRRPDESQHEVNAATEQQFKSDLNNTSFERFLKEQKAEAKRTRRRVVSRTNG